MPQLSLPELIMVVSMAAFTAIAAVVDLRTRRIPNKLTVPVFIGGIVFQIACMIFAPRFPSALEALNDMLKAFAVGFGILFVLWMIGGGGGGDVKLMGALSVWIGFHHTLWVVALSTVAVAVGSLAIIAFNITRKGLDRTRKQLAEARTPPRTADGRRPRRIMTFAFPVAVATWVVLIWFSFKPKQVERHGAAGAAPGAAAGRNS